MTSRRIISLTPHGFPWPERVGVFPGGKEVRHVDHGPDISG